MAKIADGCILLARKMLDSEIWTNKPAWWLKVWIYILMKVNHVNNGRFQRGQGFFRAESIQEACSLQLEGITKKTIHNLIKWLKSTTQITTQKTTRGMIITVCNYNEYQDLLNYKNDTENDTENEIGTKQKRNRNDTINNNGKNVKNGKKRVRGKNTLPKTKYLDFVLLAKNEYQKLLDLSGELKTKDYIERLNNHLGSKGDDYKSHYYTIRQWIKRDERESTNSDQPNYEAMV